MKLLLGLGAIVALALLAGSAEAGAGPCDSYGGANYNASTEAYVGIAGTDCTVAQPTIKHHHSLQTFVWATPPSPPYYGDWVEFFTSDVQCTTACSHLGSSQPATLPNCYGIYDQLCCLRDPVTVWIGLYLPFNVGTVESARCDPPGGGPV